MPNTDLRAVLESANTEAAALLGARAGRVTEREQKENLGAALTQALSRSTECDVRPTELQVKAALAQDWPGLGGVDLTIESAGEPIALLELKLGKDSLWNCAWDLPKLALALRRGIGQRAFMVGAAPESSWLNERQGPGLFASNRWATEAFLAQHANCYRHWKTAPVRLPSELTVEFVCEARFEANGQPFLMRVVEVTDPGAGWVDVDDQLRARVVPTGAEPERQDLNDSERVQLSDANRLLRLEGGSVYLLGDTGVYVNEAAAQSTIDEDLDAVKLLRFETSSDREIYLRDRGWLDIDRFGLGAPTALSITREGMMEKTTVSYELGGRIAISENGTRERVARPSRELWGDFNEALERIDPWSWARWYTPLRMATDGEHWQVLIAGGGQLAFSRGYLAYPSGGGESDDGFETLMESVRALFGSSDE